MKKFASAKLNLDLRVVGKLASGYHELRSLIAFSELADSLAIISAAPSQPDIMAHTYEDAPLQLFVKSHVPLDEHFFTDNLVYRVAKKLAEQKPVPPAMLFLEKHIPLGAGLGGGSADAAAALHLLNHHWQLKLSLADLAAIAAALGSDIAACLTPKAQLMSAAGNQLAPLTLHASLWVLIAYPGVHLSAGDVYRCGKFEVLTAKPLPPMPPLTHQTILLDYLQQSRNDLTTPAIKLSPIIGELLQQLEHLPNQLLTRMSGSGSACFALFDSQKSAVDAQQLLHQQNPAYFSHAGRLML